MGSKFGCSENPSDCVFVLKNRCLRNKTLKHCQSISERIKGKAFQSITFSVLLNL